MSKKIDCLVFKPAGDMQNAVMVKAIAELNAWREGNPAVRVINIETIMASTGGQFVFGQAVELRATGVRVWYEATN